MTRTMIVALVVLLGFSESCSDGGMIDNETFDEWCGNLPCGWELNAGMVVQAETWHRHDYGAELVGMPTQLSQRPQTAPADCIRIDVVASSEANAELALLIDFDDDRHFDHREALGPSSFQPYSFKVKPPLGYESVRYIVLKAGPGRATVGKLSARADTECYGERIVLDSGSACSTDASCKSGRCLAGYCSGCANGSCGEGEACAENSDCMGGACAGGVCRACAAKASCAARESCTTSNQCAHGLCVAGSLPSLSKSPEQDAVCAECQSDTECTSGHCTLGFCGACTIDAHCATGLVCRYRDLYEASERVCVPALATRLTRGQLCESDSECEPTLSCAAAPGRAKRCGTACYVDADCKGGACARTGVRTLKNSAERIKLPGFDLSPNERVATCYPRSGTDRRCSVHEQCSSSLFSSSCCAGMCSDAPVDRVTGMCGEPEHR